MKKTKPKELLVIEDKLLPEAFAFKGLDPYIKKILAEVKDIAPDLTTVKGRKEIASRGYFIARSKTFLVKTGKEITADARKLIKSVNEESTRMVKILDEAKIIHLQPLKEWEEKEDKKKKAEEKRIKEIRVNIDKLSSYEPRGDHNIPISIHKATSVQLQVAITFLSVHAPEEKTFQEFLKETEEAVQKRKEELIVAHEAAKDREKVNAEKKKLASHKKELDDKEKELTAQKEKIERKKEKVAAREKQIAKDKKQKLSDKIDKILACNHEVLPVLENLSSDEIRKIYLKVRFKKGTLEEIEIDSSFGDLEEQAQGTKDSILKDLKEKFEILRESGKKAIARDQEELKRQVKEEEARKTAEKEQKKKEKEKKRQADVEHRREINKKVLSLFLDKGFSQDEAKNVILTILRFNTPYITINYNQPI